MTPNLLAQWLDFYDKHFNPRATYTPPVYGSFGSKIGSLNGEFRPGLMWATDMAKQDTQPQIDINAIAQLLGGMK